MRHLALLGFGLLGLSSCATAGLKPIESPENGLVYGNIHLPDDVADSVQMLEQGVVYAPPFKPIPHATVFANGNFIFDNVHPGKYHLYAFGCGRRIYQVATGENAAQWAFEVKPGALVYLGSYAVANEKSSLVGFGSYEFQKKRVPDEQEILRGLVEFAKGTGWDQRIEKRLKTLSRGR